MNPLLAITLQAALLAAIVFAITKLAARHIPPAWRAALWFLVIARLLIPIAPPSPLSLQNLFVTEAPALVPAPETIIHGTPRIEVFDPETISSDAGAELRYVANVLPAPKPARFATEQILRGLWIVGAAISSFTLLGRALLLRRRISKSDAPPPQEAVDVLQGCRDEMDLRYPVRLSVSSEIAAPALTGILPARLIIPANAETFSFRELRHIFLHELAHIKLGHLAFHWLTLIARCIHWFNPVAHFAAARLRHECELAADATALARIAEPDRPAYGQTIFDALTRATATHSSLSLAMAHHTRHLEHRLRSLHNPATTRLQTFLSASLLIVLTACGLTGPTQTSAKTKPPTETAKPIRTVSGREARLAAARGDQPANLDVQRISNSAKNLVRSIEAQQKLNGELKAILIDASSFQEASELADTLKKLYTEARAGDPARRGVNFVIAGSTNAPATALEKFIVMIASPEGKIPLSEFLDRVVLDSAPPPDGPRDITLGWQIALSNSGEAHTVVFHGRPTVEKLYTRQFRLNPNTIRQKLEGVSDAADPSVRPVAGGGGDAGAQQGRGISFVTTVTNTSSINAALREFFATAGVEIPTNNAASGMASSGSGKAMFFNDRTGLLLVRATLKDLDIIESAIHLLNTAAPTIPPLAADIVPRTVSRQSENLPTFASENVYAKSFQLGLKVPQFVTGQGIHSMLMDYFSMLRQLNASESATDSESAEKARTESFTVLTNYFTAARLETNYPSTRRLSPRTWFYWDRTDRLYTQAPREELDRLDLAISTLQGPARPVPTAAVKTPRNYAAVTARVIKLNAPLLSDLSSPPDLTAFIRCLDAERRLAVPSSDERRTAFRREAFEKMTNTLATIGQNPKAEKSWAVDLRTQSLMAWATEAELAAIERGLMLLDPPPAQQVTFTAHILEATTEAAEKLLKDLAPSRSFTSTNELILLNDTGTQKVKDLSLAGSRGLLENVKDSTLSTNVVVTGREFYLSPSRVKPLLEEAKNMKGVAVLSAPILTTVIGRQARISIEESRTIMTPSTYPQGQVIPFGPVVDILASDFDGERLAYNTTLIITEFLGYDKDEKTPLPRFRVRQVNAQTKVQPGLTHLFNIPAQDLTFTRGSDLVPGVKLLPPVLTGNTNSTKRILFFMTPTLVTDTGAIAFPEKHAK